jgi:hypothetical protein
MKRIILASILLASCLGIGCVSKLVRVTVTSHQSVMDGFSKKDQVISKFGLPSSKKADGEYEEWEYLFSVKNVTEKNTNLNAMFGSNKSSISSSNSNAVGVGGMANVNSSGRSSTSSSGGGAASASAKAVTQEVRTFVKFTFKEDKVVTWSSNGVDYGTYEMKDLEKERLQREKERIEREKIMKENEKQAKKNKRRN